MYFFQSSPVSYKRFIKRFPTENSLIKLYAKTCVDFDIESKPKKRRCPHCGSCQNGPFMGRQTKSTKRIAGKAVQHTENQ